VHPQDRACALADRGSVVAGSRAVRRADLDQERARLAHDLGDAEASADLDQLTTRDDHLTSGARERAHCEQRRGGAIVDHERVLRAGELTEQGLNALAPSRALTAREIHLEIAIAGGGRRDRRAYRGRERSATEVRVHDHSGRVQNPSRRWPQARPRSGHQVDLVDTVNALEDLLAPRVELGASNRPREPIDRWQGTQAVVGVAGHREILAD
jgi:hypothetical protein